jgi:putative transposon-encoded protein
MKPYSVTLDAYCTVEKKVRDGGNSGRVFVPRAWIGKKVRVYLVEPVEEEEEEVSEE